MHPNSIRAWWTLDMDGRQAEVCGALVSAGRPMTDRQICTALGSQDMNYSRPAITHLVQGKHLEEIACIRCPVTKHWVRLVWFADVQPQREQAPAPPPRIPTSLFEREDAA